MAAAQINSEKFESSLLLANASALFIGKIGNVDEMHIRSVGLLCDLILFRLFTYYRLVDTAWPGRSPANSSRAVAEGVRGRMRTSGTCTGWDDRAASQKFFQTSR